MTHNEYLRGLSTKYGIERAGATHIFDADSLAKDAQTVPITALNNGAPAYLTSGLSAEVIKILVSPMTSTQMLPEVKYGDWLSDSWGFRKIEYSGETAMYGDYSMNGQNDANVDYTWVQPYKYQTFIRYGDMESAQAAKQTNTSWAVELQAARALTMAKTNNEVNFRGVAGQATSGLLSFPGMFPALVSPIIWNAGATTIESLLDVFNTMFSTAVDRTFGAINNTSSCKVGIHPTLKMALNKKNSFGNTALEYIETTFPGITWVTAPEYKSTGGLYTVQMIFDSLNGYKTGEIGFTHKMQSSGIVRHASHYEEKVHAGTWGAIIKQPMAIVTMTTTG